MSLKTPTPWVKNPDSDTNLYPYDSATATYDSAIQTYDGIVANEPFDSDKTPTEWEED